MKRLSRLVSPRDFLEVLRREPAANGVIISNLMRFPGMEIRATPDMDAAIVLDREKGRVLFWGDWHDLELPLDMLPRKNYFVAACPMPVLAMLRERCEMVWEEPCWHFLAPAGYGPGEWEKLGPLAPEDAELVGGYWELGGENRVEHVRECIEKYDSACIRIDGRPVSWCGLHFEIPGLGNLGFAHTLEEHRRKGYASLVTKALVNRLAARGMRATAHVLMSNTASRRLCLGLGFREIGQVAWAEFGV